MSRGLLSFSFLGRKAEYGLTIYFSLYRSSPLLKKNPKNNPHDGELMTYVHLPGRQLPKLLLHI